MPDIREPWEGGPPTADELSYVAAIHDPDLDSMRLLAFRAGWHAACHQPTETMAATAPEPDPADTRRALEEAVRAHGAAQGDGMVTDWVMSAAVASRTDPNITVYITETSDGPPHHRGGLVRRLALSTERIWTEDETDG